MTKKDVEEFMEKCRTSYANGGFLTTDLYDDFAIDAFLQKKWLNDKVEQSHKELVEFLKHKKSPIDKGEDFQAGYSIAIDEIYLLLTSNNKSDE